MAKGNKLSVGRRNFLKNAVVGAATLTARAEIVSAQPVVPREPSTVLPMSPATETEPPSDVEVLGPGERTGSDFMVDVFKSLGFEYLCANPGTSFRGLHESIINYGGNKNPEFITCCHEESSVAMAHGFYKIEGKRLCVCAHGTVGLQHASMAIYNAWCDRVPVYIVLGNAIDATKRHSYGDWDHSVQDAAATVRDFVKWDDLPTSLPHFAESAVRAYKIAMTPPMEPVVLVVDQELSENPIPSGTRLSIPELTLVAAPQGDSGAVAEAARLLVKAENPVIVLGRAARTQAGVDRLVELADLLQAPVIDKTLRMNFPTRHPLSQSVGAQPGRHGRQLIAEADVILGLEVNDFWDVVNSFTDQLNGAWRRITKPGTKLISINSEDLFSKSNYQDFQRYTEIDLDIAADVEATLPSLIDAIQSEITVDRRILFQDRRAKLAVAHVDFYKLPPGRQDEWLALYKKSHFPMMKWQIEHGQIISETVYTRAVHELSPSWDIAIVIVLPPADQRKKPELTKAQLLRKIYPDIEEYVKEERQRWTLTVEHWDERWVEVDIEKNPSLYYPSPN